MRRVELDSQEGVDGGESAFGPQVVLCVGFSAEEVEGLRGLMDGLGASMFSVVPASKAMMEGTLMQALEAENVPQWEQPPLGTRRVVVLSGMYGGELVEVVSAYRSSALPPVVFAAAVPNNIGRKLKDLVKEVTEEDAAMKRIAQEGNGNGL